MKTAQRLETIDRIDKLEAELKRIHAAQRTMRAANLAVRDEDASMLAELGFSPGHVRSLRRRQRAGQAPFPDSAFRSNAQLRRRVERELLICWGQLVARSVEGSVMLLLASGPRRMACM